MSHYEFDLPERPAETPADIDPAPLTDHVPAEPVTGSAAAIADHLRTLSAVEDGAVYLSTKELDRESLPVLRDFMRRYWASLTCAPRPERRRTEARHSSHTTTTEE